ncbi:hypothetical protein [Parvularcula oceani]|uniref:hypothetical protein n=1 Tax=Parvularcula oceani TaxID=1247963 RepID=UPI0004E28590|nr:hypothetical protein [Parvularcula oceani]
MRLAMIPLLCGLACATCAAGAQERAREARGELSMPQIGDAGRTVSQQQIAPGEARSSSVAQLEAYADLCEPGGEAPPPDIDCSEVRLMMKRREALTADELGEALAVLGRLDLVQPPSSDADRVELDGKRGLSGLSPLLLTPADPAPQARDKAQGSGLPEDGSAAVIIELVPQN